jgi:hypothetical protein
MTFGGMSPDRVDKDFATSLGEAEEAAATAIAGSAAVAAIDVMNVRRLMLINPSLSREA